MSRACLKSKPNVQILEAKPRAKMIADYKELRMSIMNSLRGILNMKITDLEVSTSGRKDIVIISSGRNNYSFSFTGKDISVEQITFFGDYSRLLDVISAVRYHKKKINDIIFLYKRITEYK